MTGWSAFSTRSAKVLSVASIVFPVLTTLEVWKNEDFTEAAKMSIIVLVIVVYKQAMLKRKEYSLMQFSMRLIQLQPQTYF
jgi:hypothetical protein